MRKRGEGAVEEYARDDVDGPPCTVPGCPGRRSLVPVHSLEPKPHDRQYRAGSVVAIEPSHSRFCSSCITRLAMAPRALLERSWAAGPDEITTVFDDMARWLAQR
jgi:hypothetical protein